MDEEKGWLRDSWRTGVVLALLLGLAFFLRVYFVWGLFYPAGFFSSKGDYSGGSDPFYWERAMFYTLQTGKEISRDLAMNYPIGFPDVRPPLFAWFNVLAGYMAAPFLGNARDASVFMLNLNAAIFGTLTLIPTYLLGKEAFGKRVGIIATLLLAISAAALQRSHATIGVHDAWTLFFVVCAFYFYLRALKTLQRSRWVENWFQLASVRKGFRAFFRDNEKSVLYAGLAGMSVAVTALSWQGWAYVPVILVLVYVVELMLDRIRNQDVLGITILFAVIFATPLIVSLPWYYVRGLIKVWWDVPFYLFAVALVLGIVFSVTRDYPWTLVIPATFVAGAVGLAIGFAVNPALLFAFVSGAGYFVKNKVYETIAEAQEPGMSELVLSYGWFTFYLGLGAIAIMIWQTPRRNNPAFTMLVLWTLGSLFMALSAARFIFNAAPVFAVATGYAIDLILIRMDFAGMRRTYRSLAEGNRRNALRKSIKMRHVLTVLFIAFLILLPNTWFAIDAAIPFELKGTYDRQVNALLPPFLQAPGYAQTALSRGTFYFGAFGYSLPVAKDYFPSTYEWLDTQDLGVPLEERPSVMAWWDYGFEITERGGHPVVADPFQNGYAIAGQFILSQNESAAIALMTIRLVEGDFWLHGHLGLGPAVNDTLNRFGVPGGVFVSTFRNPAVLAPIILANPNLYGPWDSNIQLSNAAYIFLSTFILQRLSGDRIVQLYGAVREATGWDIGYFMVDTRLFPISAQNTGIFYAPVKLSDHRVLTLSSGQVLPYDFFQILANSNRGNNLPIQILGPADQITSETIVYQPMFYNSMFYRAYVGYSPKDLGQANNTGIPGFDQALSTIAPMPAWNLTHFRVVYRTAYYNPYKDPSNHTDAWQALNYDEVLQIQKEIGAGTRTGTVDLSTQASVTNGAIILRYYDGAWVNGTVTAGGAPMPNVYVTAIDELGTPHYVTTTDAQGHYSALVPFGDITLVASAGSLTKRTLVATQVLAQATFPVSMDQAMRVNQDANGDGVVDWLMTRDFSIPSVAAHGNVYFDLSKDGARGSGDLPVAGAELTLSNTQYPYNVRATADAAGGYTAPALLPGTYRVTVRYRGHTVSASPITVGSAPLQADIAAPFVAVNGFARLSDGSPVPEARVTIVDATNGTTWSTAASSTGAYTFEPVLPGSYNLTAAAGVFASLPQAFVASSASTSQNLTLSGSGWVAGTAFVFGTPQPFATVSFQYASSPLLARTVTADASGAFNLSLPAGRWNVNGRIYQGATLYAALGGASVQAGRTTNLAVTFTSGARVNGTVSGTGVAAGAPISVGFFGSDGEWWVRIAGGGTAYTAFLPRGTYRVEGQTPTSASFGTLGLASDRTLNLAFAEATPLTGTVYWDMDGNGRFDAAEGVANARLDLTDNLGFETLAITNTTGGFVLAGYGNRTYSGRVSAEGFAPLVIAPTSLNAIGPDAHLALSPLPVSLTGSLLVNGTALLNHPVRIRAEPMDVSARAAVGMSDSQGGYSLSLVPGRYELLVDENVSTTDAWRYQNRGTDSLLLTVGEGLAGHDLHLAARALVKGNVTLGGVAVAANVTFRGPDARDLTTSALSFMVYLQPGAYTVSATRTVGTTPYSVLRNAILPPSGNLSLSLALATQVFGQLLFGGAPITFSAEMSLTRAEGGSFSVESEAGSYSVDLVPGNYTVSVNTTTTEVLGGIDRYYRYTFDGAFTITSGMSTFVVLLDLDRTLHNTTVAGTVRMDGSGVDASLTFLARGGGALNASAAVGASGAYSLGLAPGSYDVYATRAVGQGAFLGSLSVPQRDSLPYDVDLVSAHVLSGVTTDDTGTRTTAGLTISHSDLTLTLATDASGAYQILLPAGTYTVEATRTIVQQGLSVDYTATATTDLTADIVVNLQLAKVVRRAVTLSWDATQNRTTAQSASVSYTIAVHNSGNVADTFSLAGSTAGWSFTFNPATVFLNFGDAPSTAYVSVTVQAPSDALVDHAPVRVTATSTADDSAQGHLDLIVGIVRVRGLSVSVDANSGIYDGRYLNYTVTVRNSGNAPETVSVAITNPSDLAAAGWVAGIGAAGTAPAGPISSDLVVGANATTQLRLSLRQAGGASGTTVVVQVAAQDNPAVAAQTIATANLPMLQSPAGIGVTGPQILRAAPASSELFAILIGAIGAVAAALILTRKRR